MRIIAAAVSTKMAKANAAGSMNTAMANAAVSTNTAMANAVESMNTAMANAAVSISTKMVNAAAKTSKFSRRFETANRARTGAVSFYSLKILQKIFEKIYSFFNSICAKTFPVSK